MIERVLLGHFSVEKVENGLAAVERSREVNFDMILLDLDMPIMSGYDACKKIKGLGSDKGIKDILQVSRIEESQSKQAVVVALSAFVNEQVLQKCHACGFDEVGKCLTS